MDHPPQQFYEFLCPLFVAVSIILLFIKNEPGKAAYGIAVGRFGIGEGNSGIVGQFNICGCAY